MAAKSADEGESHPFLQEYIDSSTSSEDILLEGAQAPVHVPCSWRDQLVSILGEIRAKELPGRVRRGLLYALPETVCVLDAPLHPSSLGGTSVILPEQGAAAALQARLVNTPEGASGSLLVPHCHPAVTHVQLALGCCQVLVQLADAIEYSVSVYGVTGSVRKCEPNVRRQRVALDLLNEVMARASESLSDECPDSRWGGVQLAEDHTKAILDWVARLPIVCAWPLPRPVWRQGAVECIADDVVQHSDESDMQCFDVLMKAAKEGLKPAHLAEVLALRSELWMPRLPLNWVVHQRSKYELRPSRVLLHVLWEMYGRDCVTRSTHHVRLPSTLPRGTPLDPDSVFTRLMSLPGVIEWLKWTPFDMEDAMYCSTLLYLEPPGSEMSARWSSGAAVERDDDLALGAPHFQEEYARLMVVCTNCALLMVDVHWEPVPVSEKRASASAGRWSGERAQGGRGCEIQ